MLFVFGAIFNMSAMSQTTTQPYNYGIIRMFAVMAVVWGVLGMTAGVYIAMELTWPIFNFDTPAITFGRLRPVHTTLRFSCERYFLGLAGSG